MPKMLPFRSLEEAAASLGRPLTPAETLWFRYSATMPDFHIYAHSFFLLICVISLCPLPLVLMEAMGVSVLRRFKIQPNVRVPFARVVQCYRDVVAVLLLVVAPLQLTSYPLLKWSGIRTGLPLPSLWEAGAELVVYLLVEDYGNYWIHRWMHHWPWAYDKIHRVHHEFTAPVGFSATYAHWAEVLVLGLPTIAGPVIVPCHVLTLCAWIALRQMEAIESDKNGYILNSMCILIGIEFHDYHHFVGKSQSNFASVFTYCDYIYGTDKGYRYQKASLAKLRPLNSSAYKVVLPFFRFFCTWLFISDSELLLQINRKARSAAAGNAQVLHKSSEDLKSQ
ncbi:Methylsterol monooxygenase 1-1 [Nymphaea thermarum]|nr:Methylsterol monooxygenase 1-1 [Nymphaea thermarum]